MPNSRVHNFTPTSRVSNDVPISRISSFQTGRAGEASISPGTPIGLLLVLTYSEVISLPLFNDFRPNTRIVNV